MKVPFIDYELYTDIIKDIKNPETTEETSEVIKTKSRSCTIIAPFVGKIISVYQGKKYERILITPKMISFKLGQFVFTKKLGKSIHNSEHNRKKLEKIKRKITQKKVRKVGTIKKKKKKKKK